MGYGWHDQAMSGGWWVLMMIGMVIFWTVFVLGIVVLFRHYGQRHEGSAGASGSSSTAVDVLKERFARGEITEEEYSRRLALLREGS
jgi:putative membrane protein